MTIFRRYIQEMTYKEVKLKVNLIFKMWASINKWIFKVPINKSILTIITWTNTYGVRGEAENTQISSLKYLNFQIPKILMTHYVPIRDIKILKKQKIHLMKNKKTTQYLKLNSYTRVNIEGTSLRSNVLHLYRTKINKNMRTKKEICAYLL